MKGVYRLILLPLILSLLPVGYNLKSTQTAKKPNSSYIVLETSTNRIIEGENYLTPLELASTTKILTALCAIESGLDLDEIHEVPKEAVGVEGSSIYLKDGDSASLRELLYGLMLRSGNDAAVAIAKIVGGSVRSFVDLMNVTAKETGAKNSSFKNPHGLSEEGHKTTALDLALITSRALKNPIFSEIASTKKYICNLGVFYNKNRLIGSFDGANGVKTGYTKKAGRCLVASAKRDGMEIVAVFLNEPQMWEKSQEKLNTAFSCYKLETVAEKGEIARLPIENLTFLKLPVGLEKDLVVPLSKYELENLTVKTELDTCLELPVTKGQTVGRIKIYCENKLLFEQKIVTINI